MTDSILRALAGFGQSIWLDNISRSMINGGYLERLISLGLRGMTSNPTIFDKSIRLSDDYNGDIEKMAEEARPVFDIYDELTTRDVMAAADMFLPVYRETDMLDGYVSLEVNPELAFDSGGTVREAVRLWEKLARPNVMLKVPATDEGFGAVEELIACGINVNVTLIFSVGQYEKAQSAYLRGLERLKEKGGDLKSVRSVASVFVSRIDTAVDKLLKEKGMRRDLLGKAAWANSSIIYSRFKDLFFGERFIVSGRAGANRQRVLWASTSTKDPSYSDIKYVEELIARDTVNTLPEKTLKAFIEHGSVKEAITGDTREAIRILEEFRTSGIEIEEVCAGLLEAGIKAFQDSFRALLSSIEKKAGTISGKRDL